MTLKEYQGNPLVMCHVAGHNRNTHKVVNFGGVMVSTGVVEAVAASRGSRGTLKSWKINLNANDNYALAA